MSMCGYKAAVIGVSAGGLAALTKIFSSLPGNLALPMLVVQHLHPNQDHCLAALLNNDSPLTIKEAEDKEMIQPGCVYLAPPDYHLLVERNNTLALSINERVNWSRPSIDVLFESAVYAWAPALAGLILTGANHDGAHGIQLIKKHGGLTIAQDPKTAEAPQMPQSAIDTGCVDQVLSLEKISETIAQLRFYSEESAT